ncbi:MAG: hypothetical protein PHF46_05025 [Candidatus Gracilibacteria bacterium]|nr:hypothetical protein [Candidatus Gracilibacteria bacterium]
MTNGDQTQAGDDQTQTQKQDVSQSANAFVIGLFKENHPLTEFDEVYFIDLLEHSLSLNIYEKKRVIDAIPTLSQFQIDELVKVFQDERDEFRKLMPKEGDTIKKLVDEKRKEWEQLNDIYVQESKEKEQSTGDQTKINDLKKSLGI